MTTNKIVFSESNVIISVWTQAKLNDSFIPKDTNSESEMLSTSTASLPGFSSLTIKASDITVTGSNGSASVTESTENVIILTTATAEAGSVQNEPLEITAVFNEIPTGAEKFEATYTADNDGVVQLNLSLNNSSNENVFTNGDATITMTLNGKYDTLRFFDSTTESTSEQPKAYFKYAYGENGSVKTTTITFTTTHFSKFVAFLNSTGFQFPATSAEDIQFAFNLGLDTKLTNDITSSKQIVLDGKEVALDLNGHTLTTSVHQDRLFKLNDATLVVDGSKDSSSMTKTDTVHSYGLFWVNNSSLVINGGTYTVDTNGACLIAVKSGESTVELNNTTMSTDGRIVSDGLIADSYGSIKSLIVNGGRFTSTQQVTSSNNKFAMFGIDAFYSTSPEGILNDTYGRLATVSFNKVTATSNGAAVVEQSMGYGFYTDCTFTVNSTSTPSWVAASLAVSGEGICTVTNGTFTSAAYGLYVYSSGGTINVENATVNAPIVLEADLDSNSYSGSTSAINVKSGSYTGNIGTAGDQAKISITGGTFSVDPSAYCATGHTALESDNKWTVTDTVYVSSEMHGTGLNAESPMDFYYTSNQTYPSLFRTLGNYEHILDEKFKGCTVYIVGNIGGYAKNYLPVSVTIKGYGTDASFGQTLTLCNIDNANGFVANGTPKYSSDSNAVITIENIALKGSGNGSAVGIYGDSGNTMSLVLDNVKIDVTNCGAAVSFKNTTGSLTVKNCTITNKDVTTTNQHNAIVTANTGAVSITGTQMSGFNRTVNITAATSVTTGNNAVDVLFDNNKTIVYQVSSMNNASVTIGKDRSLAYTALNNTVTKSSETYYVTIHDEDNTFKTLSSALDITFLAPDGDGKSAIKSTIENFTLTNGSTATVQDGVTLAVTTKDIESGSALVYLVESGSSLESALKPIGSTPVPDIVRLVGDITAESWKVIPIAKPLTLDGNGHSLNGYSLTVNDTIKSDNYILKNITLTDKLSTDSSSNAAVFHVFSSNKASVEFDRVTVSVGTEVRSLTSANTLSNTSYYAVYFGSASTVKITDSTFMYTGQNINKYHAIEVSGNASQVITTDFTMTNSTITGFTRGINCDGATGITLNGVTMKLGYKSGSESKGVNVTVTTSAYASSNNAADRQTNVKITTTGCTVEWNDANASSSGSIYGIYLNDESRAMSLTINTNLDVAVKGQHNIAGNSNVARLYFVGDGKDTNGTSALASLTVNQNATLTVNSAVSNANGYTLKVGTSGSTEYNGTDKTFGNTTIYLETSTA